MTPALIDGPVTVHLGDARTVLRQLPTESVHCVVSSPPYWGLRDYGSAPLIWGGDADCAHVWAAAGAGSTDHLDKRRWQHAVNGRGEVQPQTKLPGPASEIRHGSTCAQCGAWRGCLGLEPTPDLYVAHLLEVCREIGRVLRPDGTLWLNLGDSYVGVGAQWGGTGSFQPPAPMIHSIGFRPPGDGLKPKDLAGVPWRVAFALQREGWYLRSDIIWAKPSAMPESVTDRPTKAHEYLFLLSRSPRYFYDAEAIKELAGDWSRPGRVKRDEAWSTGNGFPGRGDHRHRGFHELDFSERGRNKRSVWEIAARPYAERHFATFPDELVVPCVKAGTSERGCCPECGAQRRRVIERSKAGRWDDGTSSNGGRAKVNRNHGKDAVGAGRTVGWEPACQHGGLAPVPCTVLDAFAGSGTTLAVARRLGRRAIGIEVQRDYLLLIERRVHAAAMPLLEAIDEAS